jgi:serine/threonine protein kinase
MTLPFYIFQLTTQSNWAEYAIKIIQASKISEFQYMASAIREMAVLQMLSHPGVARLISNFRYKDSAYMVLEYASRGDLHSYLIAGGKLSYLHTRYVLIFFRAIFLVIFPNCSMLFSS